MPIYQSIHTYLEHYLALAPMGPQPGLPLISIILGALSRSCSNGSPTMLTSDQYHTWSIISLLLQWVPNHAYLWSVSYLEHYLALAPMGPQPCLALISIILGALSRSCSNGSPTMLTSDQYHTWSIISLLLQWVPNHVYLWSVSHLEHYLTLAPMSPQPCLPLISIILGALSHPCSNESPTRFTSDQYHTWSIISPLLQWVPNHVYLWSVSYRSEVNMVGDPLEQGRDHAFRAARFPLSFSEQFGPSEETRHNETKNNYISTVFLWILLFLARHWCH